MNFDEINLKINKPYPTLSNCEEDKRTAYLLKNLVGERNGYLSAMLRYMYQSVVADKVNPEIGEIFEELSVIKTTHLDMLMHAITEFGGNPKFEDGQNAMFNCGYVFYSQKLKEMLEFDMLCCNQTIENLKRVISSVKCESLIQLLSRLLEDEQMHQSVLKKIFNSVQFLSI